MNCSAYLTMPLRSHAEALAFSLSEAERRLTLHGPVVSIDRRTGTLARIYAADGQVMVEVVTDSGVVTEQAGYWARSSL